MLAVIAVATVVMENLGANRKRQRRSFLSIETCPEVRPRRRCWGGGLNRKRRTPFRPHQHRIVIAPPSNRTATAGDGGLVEDQRVAPIEPLNRHADAVQSRHGLP
jgi:hypothetical protein